jgi:hypothetical protein
MENKAPKPSNGFKPIKATLVPKTEPYFFYPEPNGQTSSIRTREDAWLFATEHTLVRRTQQLRFLFL